MKRVGELYEVVVFTASVSKVFIHLHPIHWIASRLTHASTAIHCLTNWTSTRSFTIGFSVRAATIIKAITSRFVTINFCSSLDRLLTFSKDLSQVGRDLRETIIIDNSPTSYIFHPQHAVPISSWFSDAHDNELLDLIPVLEDLAGSQVRDVSLVLDVSL